MKNTYLLVIVIVLLILLYILCLSKNIIKKQEKFNDSAIPISNDAGTSYSILTQIANLLNISSRRIDNLAFSKQIINGQINVFFNILEYNFLEKQIGEIDADTAKKTLENLVAKNQLIINIGNTTVIVSYVNDPTGLNASVIGSSVYTPNSKYFNNTKLLDIADYAHQVYDTVPKDETMTNFFTLGIDSDSLKLVVKPPVS